MLSLSQTTGYAILALGCLDELNGRLTQAKDIARCTDIPLPYLSKLLHTLGRAGFVIAKRGYRGGYALGRQADQITLMDVVEALGNQAELTRCLLGMEECSDERRCPLHEFWMKQRSEVEAELLRVTVRDVAAFERRRGGRLGTCSCAGGALPPGIPAADSVQAELEVR